MPELDYLVLPSARLEYVGGLFVVSLIFFHAWMVFGWLDWLNLKPLKKLGFKVVDYFWITAGGLALIGTMGQVRQMGAVDIVNAFDKLAPAVYDPVRFDVDEYLAGRGPSCRTFVHSEWSPPPDVLARIQREYDAGCEWFRKVSSLVPTGIPIKEVDLSLVPTPPVVVDADLNLQIKEFVVSLNGHNKAAQYRARLQRDTERSEVESFWLFLAPFLGSLAIALRLTKVTGEILLDRASAPKQNPVLGNPNTSSDPQNASEAGTDQPDSELAAKFAGPVDKDTSPVEG